VKEFQKNGQKQILKSNYKKVNLTEVVMGSSQPPAMPTSPEHKANEGQASRALSRPSVGIAMEQL
jgi:hypothetical protein